MIYFDYFFYRNNEYPFLSLVMIFLKLTFVVNIIKKINVVNIHIKKSLLCLKSNYKKQSII